MVLGRRTDAKLLDMDLVSMLDEHVAALFPLLGPMFDGESRAQNPDAYYLILRSGVRIVVNHAHITIDASTENLLHSVAKAIGFRPDEFKIENVQV